MTLAEAVTRRRLDPNEVGIIKYFAHRHVNGLRFLTLGRDLRPAVIPMWREGMIELWYRQYPDDSFGHAVGKYCLSHSGRMRASAILRVPASVFDPAPRGFSGVEP